MIKVNSITIEFVMAGQSVLHTTVMFHGDCANIFEDSAQSFGERRTSLASQRNISLSSFTREIFTKNKMTVASTYTTFLFLRMKIKLKGRHFDTTEVIEAGSQTVSRMHLKYGRSPGNGEYA
jgi:hypothetical protein